MLICLVSIACTHPNATASARSSTTSHSFRASTIYQAIVCSEPPKTSTNSKFGRQDYSASCSTSSSVCARPTSATGAATSTTSLYTCTTDDSQQQSADRLASIVQNRSRSTALCSRSWLLHFPANSHATQSSSNQNDSTSGRCYSSWRSNRSTSTTTRTSTTA